MDLTANLNSSQHTAQGNSVKKIHGDWQLAAEVEPESPQPDVVRAVQFV
jgi:hypothetical protein